MKIQNLEVTLKIGNKEKKFTNLILNSYLELFAESFIEFKEKDLNYCLINFTKENHINEKTKTMQYDTIYETEYNQIININTENNIINKYKYTTPSFNEEKGDWYSNIESFSGKQLKDIGFARYDFDTNKYILYAYLDLTKYNIIINEKQPVIITRIDKVHTDMNFYSDFKELKYPYHLTNKSIRVIEGYDYTRILPKLYSIGFGILPNVCTKEYPIEELKKSKINTGKIKIVRQIQNLEKIGLYPDNNLYTNNNLYPIEEAIKELPFINNIEKEIFIKNDLYCNNNLYPLKQTNDYIMYKFKMYEETFPDPQLPPIYVDTGMTYIQYTKLDKFGELYLYIEYTKN